MNEFFLKNLTKIFIAEFFIILICIGIGMDTPIYDQDEAAYMGFTHNMIEKGNFLIQDFPLSDPHRKPPLHFWLSSALYSLNPGSVFLFRVPNLFFFSGIIIVSILLSYSMYKSRSTSLLTGIILLTSLFIPIYTQIHLTDIPLVFYNLLGIFSLWKITEDKIEFTILPSGKFFYVLLFWISVALGVLQKGPPTLISLGGLWFFILIFSSHRFSILRTHPILFFPISLIPLVLWGYFSWQKDGGVFILWMIDWYILKRTSGSVFGQSGPPGTYYLILFVFLFPWSYWLWDITKHFWIFLRRGFNSITKDKSLPMTTHRQSFILGWFIFSFAFFELLPSKLPSYVLTSYPLLAILIAKMIDPDLSRDKYNSNDSPNKFYIFKNVLFITLSLIIILFLISIPFSFSLENSLNGNVRYMILLILGVGFTSPIFKRYSEYKVAIWATLGVVLHIFLSLFYLIEVHKTRDYGEALSKVLTKNIPSDKTDNFKSDKVKIDNIKINKLKMEDLKIIIHPEIRLPSIPLRLVLSGISSDNILIQDPIFEDSRAHEKKYTLVPFEYWTIFKSLDPKKELVACHEFFAYESGKNLNLCWIK